MSALALLLALGLLVTAQPAVAQPAQPNIVFIMLDDAGYADFGATGSGFIQTPNVDAFSQQGTAFSQYYANAPLCSPTRVSLMTGEYPATMWMRHNGKSSITTENLTLPQILASEGYTTGHFGKWHIHANDGSDFHPLVAGFDHDVRFKSKLAQSFSYFDPFITIDNSQVVHHVGEHLTTVLTDYAIDFVADHAASGPFYLELWHWAPHNPLEPPPSWAERYPDTEPGKLAAMVSDADEQIGRLLAALDAHGIADDTMVVITSDNGGDNETHGDDPASGPSNAPFRGHKLDVYEGGMRVPFFARWANGGIVPGSANNSVAMGFDLIHTFAEVAGADISGLGLPGTSLVAALSGDVLPRTERLFWEKKTKGRFYVDPEGIVDDFAVREGDWKLVREDNLVQLFDMAADPEESTDLAASFPAEVEVLLAANQAWRLETGLVEHAVGRVVGDVEVEGDVFTFSGGYVELERSPYFDIRKKDFSLLASVTPSLTPTGSERVIAKRNKSWDLMFLANDRIRLRVFDLNGSKTVLLTPPLALGQTYDVAFTVFGWQLGGSSVRLYLDGVLQAETFELEEVERATTPIKVGNSGTLGKPLFGVIEDLSIYSVTLRPHEIDDLFAVSS